MSPIAIESDIPDLTPTDPILKQKPIVAVDSGYTIREEPIGTRRPIRVVCLGAGYSGLMMAIVFSQRMQNKNADFVIYERNNDLGGTWLVNRSFPHHPSSLLITDVLTFFLI